MLRRRAQRFLGPVLPLIQRLRYGQPNPIEPWRTDPAFREVMVRVAERTLVDEARCYMLWQLLRGALRVEGDVVEVGVLSLIHI